MDPSFSISGNFVEFSEGWEDDSSLLGIILPQRASAPVSTDLLDTDLFVKPSITATSDVELTDSNLINVDDEPVAGLFSPGEFELDETELFPSSEFSPAASPSSSFSSPASPIGTAPTKFGTKTASSEASAAGRAVNGVRRRRTMKQKREDQEQQLTSLQKANQQLHKEIADARSVLRAAALVVAELARRKDSLA